MNKQRRLVDFSFIRIPSYAHNEIYTYIICICQQFCLALAVRGSRSDPSRRDCDFCNVLVISGTLSFQFSVFPNQIPHGPVSALTLFPHPGKLWVVVLDVVVDAHILLVGMFLV